MSRATNMILKKSIAIFLFTILCIVGLWFASPFMYNPLKITIHISAEKQEICQVFYDDGKGFSGEKSIKEKYLAGGFKKLEFNLPRMKIYRLRIDPGYQADKYLIHSISIEAGEFLKTYSGKNILDHFKFVHLQPDSISRDYLTLNTTDNPDAQLIFKPQINANFPLVKHNLRKAIVITFALFYIAGLLLIILVGYRLFLMIRNILKEVKLFFRMYLTIEKLHIFWNHNRGIIIWSFLLAIFSFGYELFNFSLSPDEEINSFREAGEANVYLNVGRWGIFFLNQLLSPESILPYFPFLISITCLAISSILIITRFKMNFFAMLVFSIIFISHPIHSYYLGFNTSNMYYGIGMVLTVLAFLAYSSVVSNQRPRLLLSLLSVILLMFGISFYQSHLAFFLVLCLFFLFYHQYQNPEFPPRKTFTNILFAIAIGVIAVILYQFINLASKYIILGRISGISNEYLDKMFAWGKKPIIEIIGSLYTGLPKYFTGKNFYGGISAQTVIVIIPLIIYYILKIYAPFKNKLFIILMIIILLFTPFTIVLLNGMPLPVRTLMAFPLMLGLLWAFGYDYSARWFKNLMLLFAFYILINNTFINTRLFYASKVSWEADRNMAVRISNRIYDLDLPENKSTIPVVFVGSYQHPSNVLFLRSDIHGASFFMWDNGASYRIRAFFKTLGITNLNIIDYSYAQHLSGEISKMPSWPDKGSVKMIENIIIVKLSEPTNEFR